jgi:hypothetical protein
MFIAFVPMFAIREIDNLLREGKLFELFFERGGSAGNRLPDLAKGGFGTLRLTSAAH